MDTEQAELLLEEVLERLDPDFLDKLANFQELSD